jgi:Fungal specific transcription factor domain
VRPKSPNVASGLYYDPPLGTLSTFDPFSILPEMIGEPVPKQLLIRYYLERLAPWFCYLEDNLADIEPRIAWLPFALVHQPFFYATLLTAAVHLNRKRRFRDPAALLWFKAETIRAANEKMNDPAEAASDEMIMVALILLVFNVSSRFSGAKV